MKNIHALFMFIKIVEDIGEHNCEAKTMFKCIKYEEDLRRHKSVKIGFINEKKIPLFQIRRKFKKWEYSRTQAYVVLI